MLKELYAHVSSDQAHEIRLRQRAEKSVSVLLHQDETPWQHVQAHSRVSSRSACLRDRN